MPNSQSSPLNYFSGSSISLFLCSKISDGLKGRHSILASVGLGDLLHNCFFVVVVCYELLHSVAMLNGFWHVLLFFIEGDNGQQAIGLKHFVFIR